jgi:hypothetical protein
MVVYPSIAEALEALSQWADELVQGTRTSLKSGSLSDRGSSTGGFG